MVVDTSAILAIFFNEKEGPWFAEVMEKNRGSLRMSTVNLAEALILLKDRQPQIFKELREKLFTSSIRFVPPTPKQAEMAAIARLEYPLNLGDCFVYALAKDEGLPILTNDPDFKKTDIRVLSP